MTRVIVVVFSVSHTQSLKIVTALDWLLAETEKGGAGDAPTLKVLTDSSRRIKTNLYSKLRRRVLSQPVLEALGKVADALQPASTDAPATPTTVQPLIPPLMTAALSHSREGDDSAWTVGVKRVVEVWAKGKK
ncbi:hypothetical protein HDU93_003259 [Gonapodya sp. JEL0774]|nr:hypothetical protein HDU93_003259 [Gonapodya sp. JEL0774]